MRSRASCRVVIMNDEDDFEYVVGCAAAHPDQRGGQHVARSCSGVLVVHKPTGLGCRCLEERSQIKNKTLALARLKSALQAIGWYEEQRHPGDEEES